MVQVVWPIGQTNREGSLASGSSLSDIVYMAWKAGKVSEGAVFPELWEKPLRQYTADHRKGTPYPR